MSLPDPRMPVVYIAGPYTHPDPCENTRRAVVIADQLYNERICYPLVPHLTMLWHTVLPRPVEDWCELDLAHLASCGGVIRFSGDSTGADREVAYAEALGIPVLLTTAGPYSSDELQAVRDWIRSWPVPENTG